MQVGIYNREKYLHLCQTKGNPQCEIDHIKNRDIAPPILSLMTLETLLSSYHRKCSVDTI